MHIGAHISISEGFSEALRVGKKINCDCIQIFTQNQRQWRGRDVSFDEASDFKKTLIETKITHIASHNSYLINLSSPDELIYSRSIGAFIDEIKRCKMLSINYIIFHPGSHMKKGEDWGIKRVSSALNEIIDRSENNDVMLLLETTAGQGSNLGYKFEQLAQIINKVKSKKIMGVCFDTCHSFTAGYDFRTKELLDNTLELFDNIIGLDYLKGLHLNDSKFDFATKKDRHEDIGKGFLGIDAFRHIINHPYLSILPMYLETPSGLENYKKEIKLLRKLKNNP